jgi:hypothetical protein
MALDRLHAHPVAIELDPGQPRLQAYGHPHHPGKLTEEPGGGGREPEAAE